MSPNNSLAKAVSQTSKTCERLVVSSQRVPIKEHSGWSQVISFLWKWILGTGSFTNSFSIAFIGYMKNEAVLIDHCFSRSPMSPISLCRKAKGWVGPFTECNIWDLPLLEIYHYNGLCLYSLYYSHFLLLFSILICIVCCSVIWNAVAQQCHNKFKKIQNEKMISSIECGASQTFLCYPKLLIRKTFIFDVDKTP